MATRVQVAIDCTDPANLSAFWAFALHYHLQDPPEGFPSWPAFLESQGIPNDRWNDFSAIVDPGAIGPRIFFQKVPEGKAAKNRLHLDLNVTPEDHYDEQQQYVMREVTRLVGAGATKVREVEQMGEFWVVMQDPEGNEFCLQ
ncbi:MAG: VOC family protein [Actinomycetota bacterium]|nr:VOC family protein [Actinomycetota bacterium]